MFFKKTPDDIRASEFLNLFSKQFSLVSKVYEDTANKDGLVLETQMANFDTPLTDRLTLWLNKYATESSAINLNEYVIKFTATFDKNRLDEIIGQLQVNDNTILPVA